MIKKIKNLNLLYYTITFIACLCFGISYGEGRISTVVGSAITVFIMSYVISMILEATLKVTFSKSLMWISIIISTIGFAL